MVQRSNNKNFNKKLLYQFKRICKIQLLKSKFFTTVSFIIQNKMYNKYEENLQFINKPLFFTLLRHLLYLTVLVFKRGLVPTKLQTVSEFPFRF